MRTALIVFDLVMYVCVALFVITELMPDAAWMYKLGVCYFLAHMTSGGVR